jgi:hypothetical protein
MSGLNSEYKMDVCPKRKKHSKGANMGQKIEVAVFGNKQIGCPEIGRCGDLCPAIYHSVDKTKKCPDHFG